MTGISDGSGEVAPTTNSMYAAHLLIMQFSISKALQAVLKLGIPDILASAEGQKLMTAEEILAQLPTKSTPGPTSVDNLKRLLTPLVREGMFSEGLTDDKKPCYGLTDVSKWFLRNEKINVLPIADVAFAEETQATWDFLNEVILDETTTVFLQAHGQPVYEYVKTHPESGRKFQAAMTCSSQNQLRVSLGPLLNSGVLDGVNTLVDVGGGRGTTIGKIVSYRPHIRGINFDLPYVISTAPPTNGVEHVAGSFFEDPVPSGDAILLKYIIHMFNDEDAIKVLQNCFNALPQNGKVIVAEYFLMENTESTRAKYIESLNLTLLGVMVGGRERTQKEYEELLIAAGFPRRKVIHNPGSIDFIEAFKE